MLRTMLVALHAFGSTVAFFAGLSAVLPRTGAVARQWAFQTFSVSLGFGIGSLLTAVGTDWRRLPEGDRIVFTGLVLLALYMGYRAYLASLALREDASGSRADYSMDVGFVLVALFDGFLSVLALQLGAPVSLVIAIASATVVTGRLLLRAAIGRRPPAGAALSSPPS